MNSSGGRGLGSRGKIFAESDFRGLREFRMSRSRAVNVRLVKVLFVKTFGPWLQRGSPGCGFWWNS